MGAPFNYKEWEIYCWVFTLYVASLCRYGYRWRHRWLNPLLNTHGVLSATPYPQRKKFLGTPLRDSFRETVDIWYFIRKGNREIPIQFCLTRSFKYTSQPRHVVVFIPAASLTREERAIEPGPSWARMEEMDHDISVDVDVEEMEIIRLLTAVNTYGSPIAPPGWTRNRSKQHVTLSFGKHVSNPIESSCKSSLHLLCERLDQNHLFNRRFRYKIIWFRHRRVAVRIRAAVKIPLKTLTVLEMNCSLNWAPRYCDGAKSPKIDCHVAPWYSNCFFVRQAKRFLCPRIHLVLSVAFGLPRWGAWNVDEDPNFDW